MRLYSLSNATAVDDPQFGRFQAGDDGAFTFPDELGRRLQRVHAGGVKQWETDVERQRRIAAEEMARRQDPATLLATLERLVAVSEQQKPEPPQPKPRGRRPARPEGDGE